MSIAIPTEDLRVGRKATAERTVDQPYFAAARDQSYERQKTEERRKVLRHILDNRPKGTPPLKLLTNPGMHWRFERMVELEIGEHRAFFVGIERSWQVMECGLKYMPGRHKVTLSQEERGVKITGYATAKGAILNTPIENLPGFLLDLPQCELEFFAQRWKKTLYEGLVRWRGFWIDVWAPLCRPRMAMFLRQMTQYLDRDANQIPYAITCQYGRDEFLPPGAPNTVEGRAEMAAAELSHSGHWRAETKDCWHYFGFNETRLFTACGVLHRVKQLRG